MNKHNLTIIALKELEELKVMLNGIKDMENIPPLIFQLSDVKFNNLQSIFAELKAGNTEHSQPVENTLEEKIEEKQQEIIVELEEPIFIELPVEETIIEEVVAPKEVEVKEEIVAEEPVIFEIEQKEEAPQKKPINETTKVEKPVKKNIIAETLIEKKSSVNEKLSSNTASSLDKTLSESKITDLKKSINLNDKIRFQRELFKGNAALLNQTLDVLNESENKEDAMDFLSSYEWDEENPTVKDFMKLVNRKFL
jgi:hypothetical protein